ncbi:MAG: PorT family protein [Myxococcales bacterium]|nr:PorT family protein [Myxococcales bacterium]
MTRSLSSIAVATVASFVLPVTQAAAASGRSAIEDRHKKDDKQDDKKDDKKEEAKKVAPKKEAAKKKPPAAKAVSPKDEPPPDTEWVAGLVGGVNFAMAGGEGSDRLDSKIGFDAGLRVLRYLAPFADFETGLAYTIKGYQLVLSDPEPNDMDDLEVTSADTFNYVEVPLMMRLAMPGATVKPFFHGGIYVAFLVSSERAITAKYEYGMDDPGSVSVTPEVPGASGFDAGLRVGAGLEYRVTDAFSIMAEIDFERGFTDPVDETAKPSSSKSVVASLPEAVRPDAEGDVEIKAVLDKTRSKENIGTVHQGILVNFGLAYHF